MPGDVDYELHIVTGDQRTQRVVLEGESLSIGRAHGTEISFPEDASLSRRQLKLVSDDEGWCCEDMGSKNGTLLNGVRISARERLHAGDRLSAGHLVMTFVDPRNSSAGQVQFVQQAGPEIRPEATVKPRL